jgi:hypothetical protein
MWRDDEARDILAGVRLEQVIAVSPNHVSGRVQRRISLVLVTRTQVQPVSLQTR